MSILIKTIIRNNNEKKIKEALVNSELFDKKTLIKLKEIAELEIR